MQMLKVAFRSSKFNPVSKGYQKNNSLKYFKRKGLSPTFVHQFFKHLIQISGNEYRKGGTEE